MIKRSILTCLLAVSLVLGTVSSSLAISGWFFEQPITFSTGSFCGTFNIKHVKNVEKNPALISFSGDVLEGEISCTNNGGQAETAKGNAHGPVAQGGTLEASVVDEGKGKITIMFCDDLTELEQLEFCPNDNWSVDEGSGVATLIDARFDFLECTGPDGDCSETGDSLGMIHVLCELTDDQRDANGDFPDGSVYTCIDIDI